jgi:chromosome segregation ATPase
MTIHNNFMKTLVWLVLIGMVAAANISQAAKREGGGESAKMVAKLQAMVKDITSERDLLKTENSKVTAELETLKTQVEQGKKDKEAAVGEQEKLAAEVAAQKAAGDEIHGRLDNTTAKLREVVEKYNALNKAKNELAAIYANLQNTQQFTASELKACESKNLKMYEGAKEVVEGFQNCQNKGILDTLVDSEPFTQINNVEFETIMQGYEDKLNKQKYHGKTPVKSVQMPLASEPSPARNTAPPVAPAPATVKPATPVAPAPSSLKK